MFSIENVIPPVNNDESEITFYAAMGDVSLFLYEMIKMLGCLQNCILFKKCFGWRYCPKLYTQYSTVFRVQNKNC